MVKGKGTLVMATQCLFAQLFIASLSQICFTCIFLRKRKRRVEVLSSKREVIILNKVAVSSH